MIYPRQYGESDIFFLGLLNSVQCIFICRWHIDRKVLERVDRGPWIPMTHNMIQLKFRQEKTRVRQFRYETHFPLAEPLTRSIILFFGPSLYFRLKTTSQ